MDTARPLKVCLDARFADIGHCVGVRTTVAGLASALAELDGDEQYFFLAFQDSHEWLRPFLRNGCRILPVTRRPPPRWRGFVKRLPGVAELYEQVAPWISQAQVGPSDGTLEREGIEVMHFTAQGGFLTDIPTIFAPQDLQHLHLPELFTPRTHHEREVVYRTLCQQAAAVTVMSTQSKQDLVQHFGLPADKIAVIPLAPANAFAAESALPEQDIVRQKYALPSQFAFFPAETWEHKNHIGLLEALAIVRSSRQTNIPLVCTGHPTEFFATVMKRVRELKLTDQVRFLGFLPASEIQCLYRMSRCLIFPTRFEGWGLPLTEAFYARVPAVCSNISPLKEQAAGAALFFDPRNPESIAQALWKVWTDEPLRQRLVRAGAERLKLFSWDHTARLFRALYRKLGNRLLTEEDRALLASPPLT